MQSVCPSQATLVTPLIHVFVYIDILIEDSFYNNREYGGSLMNTVFLYSFGEN